MNTSNHNKEECCCVDCCWDRNQEALLKTTLLIDTEDDRGCPCLLTTPCHGQCTCAHPSMSAGCRRCCRYGDVEQRKAIAEHIARILDDAYAKEATIRNPVDAELREIHFRCQTAFTTGDFGDIAKMLDRLPIETMAADVLVCWLSATVCAKVQLESARRDFVERCRLLLVREFGEDRVKNIYSRLG